MSLDWDVISAAAAALATLVSLLALFVTQRSQKRMEELADRQNRLAHQSWTDEYFRDITDWASEVCRAIARAIHIVGQNDGAERHEVLVTLSACIDMGRWYLPNRVDGGVGMHKEPAYRGLRQPALDWIVEAYDVCRRERDFENPHKELVACQRNFVSAIQEVLDPRSREASIRHVLDSFATVAARSKVESPHDDDKFCV